METFSNQASSLSFLALDCLISLLFKLRCQLSPGYPWITSQVQRVNTTNNWVWGAKHQQIPFSTGNCIAQKNFQTCQIQSYPPPNKLYTSQQVLYTSQQELHPSQQELHPSQQELHLFHQGFSYIFSQSFFIRQMCVTPGKKVFY